MRIIAAFLFLVSAALVYGYSVKPRQNLDPSQYKGRWYLIETGPIINSSVPLDCVYEEYIETDNPFLFTLQWQGKQNGSIILQTGVVAIPRPMDFPASWNFYVDGTVFNSQIIATDYNKWSIEYTSSEPYFERFMIRSRTPSLNPDILSTLRSVIDGFGVDPSWLIPSRQSNC